MPKQFPESFNSLTPASPVKRLLALLYDTMIIVSVWMLIGGIAVAINRGEAVDGSLLQISLFILSYLFFAFFWTRTGQTLGMQSWRLRVQTPEGSSLTATQSLIRFIGASVSILAFGLGYLWMFIDKKGLSWHDRMSGTCIVTLPKKNKDDQTKS